MDACRQAILGLQEDAAQRIDAALRATLPKCYGGKSVAKSSISENTVGLSY
jgi:hypothetical protein